MEYLTTYGWSILIIAIVLAALFGLGPFSSVSQGTECIARTGFLCNNLAFSTNTAGPTNLPFIIVNIGVATPYTNVYLAVVPLGQVLTDTSIANQLQPYDFLWWSVQCGGSDTGTNFFSALALGQQVQAQLNFCRSIIHGPLVVGTHINGAIWAMYSTPTVTNALIEVGSFSAVASRG
jgi:hypothetical protein